MSGDTRLTPTSFVVLGLVESAGEATPYDLKRTVAGGLGSFWSLPHAQLYAEPQRLAAAGLLAARQEPEGRRRKYYRITPSGAAALEAWRAEPTEEPTELRDLAMLKIFFGADPAEMAAAQLPVRRAKVAAYERLRDRLDEDAPAGIRLILDAGIGHEREWVRLWTEVAAAAASSNPSSGSVT